MEKLLLVATEQKDFEEHMVYLQSEGFDCYYEKNEKNVMKRIENEGYTGILFSYKKNWHQYFAVGTDIKEKTQIPVFMMSEHASEIEAICALKKGIYYFPMGSTPLYTSSLIKLYLSERAHLARKKKEQEVSYDIEVKEGTKQTFVRGEKVNCSGKTFDLLMYLIKRDGEYTTEEDIFRNVWKCDTLQGYKDNVRVYIKKLRDILSIEETEESFIQNARGKGYRLMGTCRTLKSLFFV